MGPISKSALHLSALVVGTLTASAALAKPADCFTSDDGHYSCDFRGIDNAGSFRISAPGYPTFTLQVESPGVAWIQADFGQGNVNLPGPYYRAEDDGACWENPDTDARVCAW